MREPNRPLPRPQIVASAVSAASLAALLSLLCSARSSSLVWSSCRSPNRTRIRAIGGFSTHGAFSIFLTVFFFLAAGCPSPDGTRGAAFFFLAGADSTSDARRPRGSSRCADGARAGEFVTSVARATVRWRRCVLSLSLVCWLRALALFLLLEDMCLI